MIRINLMPRKREPVYRLFPEGGQLWLLVVAGLMLLEVIGLLFFHSAKQGELDQILRDNRHLSTNIEELRLQLSNHTTIKVQLKELREREEAINKLQAARTGPTAILLELSRILTTGRGPTVDREKLEQLRRDNPGAVPNPSWDPRRLWLSQYSEVDRAVRLMGLARDGSDIAEFMRRLSLSDYFYDVNPLPASEITDSITKIRLMKFELSAKVRY